MPASNGQSDNFASVVTEVTDRVTVLVREEVELAKAEMSQKANSLARGAAAVGAGAVFGVFALIFGLATIAWAINDAVGNLWLGFLIVFVVLALLAAGAFFFASRKLRVGAPTPQMAIDEAKKIRATVTATTEGEPSRLPATTEDRR